MKVEKNEWLTRVTPFFKVGEGITISMKGVRRSEHGCRVLRRNGPLRKRRRETIDDSF